MKVSGYYMRRCRSSNIIGSRRASASCLLPPDASHLQCSPIKSCCWEQVFALRRNPVTRGGLRVVGADLFSDVDTLRAAQVTRIAPEEYPIGFVQFAEQTDADAWSYTGCLENEPEIVERISRLIPLRGNSRELLRRVRDPFLVSESLSSIDLPPPELRSQNQPPSTARWLRKVMSSGGGLRVEFVGVDALPRHTPFFYQQFVEGPSFAAIFVANGHDHRYLGLTRQWLRRDLTNRSTTREFQYVGSSGPVYVTKEVRRQLDRLGTTIVRDFGLQGIFGVDLVCEISSPYQERLTANRIWPIEINPRYTASVEVLELATGKSAFSLHRDGCLQQPWKNAEIWGSTPNNKAWAKRISVCSRGHRHYTRICNAMV